MMAALARPPSLRARGRAMLYLLFDTGIRASELADIRLGDLDLEAGVLRVRGKGSQRQRVKWRTVGMGVRAQRAVQQYAFRHRPPAIPVGKDRVFLTRDGRRMTRNTVHRFVKRLGRSAGVERAPPPTCSGTRRAWRSCAAAGRRACFSGSSGTPAARWWSTTCIWPTRT